jgi:ATP-binding cassette, subfamily B (MDR/TAP), member 9
LCEFSAVSAGVRGGFFKVAMARLNIRIRNALFSSIVHQEVGFFDVTKTGNYVFILLFMKTRNSGYTGY